MDIETVINKRNYKIVKPCVKKIGLRSVLLSINTFTGTVSTGSSFAFKNRIRIHGVRLFSRCKNSHEGCVYWAEAVIASMEKDWPLKRGSLLEQIPGYAWCGPGGNTSKSKKINILEPDDLAHLGDIEIRTIFSPHPATRIFTI